MRVDHARGLCISYSWVKAVDAIAIIQLTTCNKWEQNPEYEKVLS
jgi:hypothetical protein